MLDKTFLVKNNDGVFFCVRICIKKLK